MQVDYQYHIKRRKRATRFWLKVAKEYNDGLSAQDIAKKYKNPLTGKNYTRGHIYWILQRIKNGL